jgi:hypothetical protein
MDEEPASTAHVVGRIWCKRKGIRRRTRPRCSYAIGSPRNGSDSFFALLGGVVLAVFGERAGIADSKGIVGSVRADEHPAGRLLVDETIALCGTGHLKRDERARGCHGRHAAVEISKWRQWMAFSLVGCIAATFRLTVWSYLALARAACQRRYRTSKTKSLERPRKWLNAA